MMSLRRYLCTLPLPAVSIDTATIAKLTQLKPLVLCFSVLAVIRFILNISSYADDILKGSTDLLTSALYYAALENWYGAGLSWLTLVILWGYLSVLIDGASLVELCFRYGDIDIEGARLLFNGLITAFNGIGLQLWITVWCRKLLREALPLWLEVAAGLDSSRQHYISLL